MKNLPKEHKVILDEIIAMALDAGDMIMNAAQQGTNIATAEEKTSKRDLVTQVDKNVQKMLVRRCRKLIPDCSFYCEETDAAVDDIPMRTDNAGEGWCFIIDPIDGTANFVYDLQHSCTSIALLKDGVTIYGVVYDPYKEEMFAGVHEHGSWLNGQRLLINPLAIENRIAAFGTSPYNPEDVDKTLEICAKLYTTFADVRRGGSAALDCCYVACSRFAMYAEMHVSPWDVAAGVLIAYEAGAISRTIEGLRLPVAEKSSIQCGCPHALGMVEFSL